MDSESAAYDPHFQTLLILSCYFSAYLARMRYAAACSLIRMLRKLTAPRQHRSAGLQTLT